MLGRYVLVPIGRTFTLMYLQHPLRMPLQTGTSAVRSLARASAALVPALLPPLLLVHKIQSREVAIAGAPDQAPLLLIGSVVLFTPLLVAFAGARFYRFFRTLPRDIIISADGIAVQGRSRTYSWDELSRPACSVKVGAQRRLTLW